MFSENSLIDAKTLSRHLGVTDLFIKLETLTGVGCHKSRAAKKLVSFATENQFKGISVGTCGNLGIALACESIANQIPLKIFVPFHQQWCETLCASNPQIEIVSVNGTYEDAVERSSQFADKNQWFDASPVGIAHAIAVEAFSEIAFEIINNTKNAIGSVYVPVGNGTTLIGISKGFMQNGLSPKMHAIGSAGNSAVCTSLKEGKYVELDSSALRETWINQPLVNWRALSCGEAMEAVVKSGGKPFEVTDEQLVDAANLLQQVEGINAHPCGAAGLAGLMLNLNHEKDNGVARIIVVTAKAELVI